MKWVRTFGMLMIGGLLLGAPGQTPVKKAGPAGDFDRIAKEAAAAREQNRVDDALQLYKQAVKLKPGWNEGWWWLGALQYDLDRYPDARDAFKKFIALD